MLFLVGGKSRLAKRFLFSREGPDGTSQQAWKRRGRRCREFSVLPDTENSHFRYEDILGHAPACQKLKNEHDQGDDENQMNQAAGHMESEAKRPHHEKNNKNGPEHNQVGF